MKKVLGLIALGVLVSPVASAGVIYGFAQITNNGPVNVESQLTVEVSDIGGGQVQFTFRNAVGTASSITDVYFDDGTLLGIASVSGSAGVSFSSPATPAELPGANAVNFVTTADFSADSDSPVSANGVNASTEFLNVVFTLLAGNTYAGTLAALDMSALSPGVDLDGGLRIGMHVQSIGAAGESNGYVNIGRPRIPVPEPAPIVLLGVGLAVLAFWKRRAAR